MINFKSIKHDQLQEVFKLATEIWNDNYQDMISQDQINYMLNLMYNPERIQQDISEGYVWEFIYHHNKIVGYLAYVIKNDRRVFLSKIYLKTTAQGLGIGKLAIERIKNYTKDNQCKTVYLTVNKGNKKGIRAYKKSGFTITAEEVTDIGNGYVMDDYIFEYPIQN